MSQADAERYQAEECEVDGDLAQHATEICGCPPGKVGYFNHGQCACSGDPISPSYEIEMPKTTGPHLDSRITQHGPPPKQVQYNCPPCPRHFWSYKDYLGKCRCRPPLQKRELSFKKIESFQEKRQAPVHSYPGSPDGLFLDKDDVKWQKDRVNEKICPPGLRGTVVRDGHCKCLPKKTGRDISSMDPELHMKPEAVSPSFSLRVGSSSTPSAEAQHKCFLSKPCPPGQGSWPVKDDCVCTELDKEQDGSNRNESEHKRNALVTDEEKGEYVYRTVTITTCHRSPECSKVGRGWHGVPFHNRCICVPPLDKTPHDTMVSAKLSDRSSIEDALSQHHTVEKRGASVTIGVRETPFLEKRHNSGPCSHIQCPSGYIPTFDLCFCKRDSGHSFSRLPGPAIDGHPLGKSPQWKDRKSNVQIPVIDDSITIPFPPQQNYNGPEPHHMCAEPQCPYRFIFHSDGVCECINSQKKRQDSGSCGDFSCPAGFAPKLNGQICYCGMDENSPLPQGPASLGPHGGMPGGYEQDLSS
ncbi:MAG: hypothetical protein Q9188_001473 [Gyalolechia gomerana]